MHHYRQVTNRIWKLIEPGIIQICFVKIFLARAGKLEHSIINKRWFLSSVIRYIHLLESSEPVVKSCTLPSFLQCVHFVHMQKMARLRYSTPELQWSQEKLAEENSATLPPSTNMNFILKNKSKGMRTSGSRGQIITYKFSGIGIHIFDVYMISP